MTVSGGIFAPSPCRVDYAQDNKKKKKKYLIQTKSDLLYQSPWSAAEVSAAERVAQLDYDLPLAEFVEDVEPDTLDEGLGDEDEPTILPWAVLFVTWLSRTHFTKQQIYSLYLGGHGAVCKPTGKENVDLRARQAKPVAACM